METMEEDDYLFVTPCDACNVKAGEQRCTQCKCVFYCSRECQTRHWKEHRGICVGLRKFHAEFVWKDHKQDKFTEIRDGSADKECAVCLERIANNPLVLPCNHTFCVDCIRQHHAGQWGPDTPCPLCRSTRNVWQYTYANAVHFANRARRDKAKKRHFCELSRRVLTAFQPEEKGPEINSLEAELLYLEESYEAAVAASEALLATKPAESIVLSLLSNIIHAHMDSGKYSKAMDTIKAMLRITDDPVKYMKEIRFLFHSTSTCKYHLGDYSGALSSGKFAAESNRHYEGVHEPIARSYWALGQYDKAILTMRRAVRYETPWDPSVTAANQKVLDEMLAEYAKITAAASAGAGAKDGGLGSDVVASASATDVEEDKGGSHTPASDGAGGEKH